MKKVPTVHKLRQEGFKVRVTHVRKFYRFDPKSGKKTEFFAPFQSSKMRKKQNEIISLQSAEQPTEVDADESSMIEEEFFLCGKGGETIIEIASSEHKELGKGIAHCSEKDSYVKNYGVKKAIAMALKNMENKKDPYFHIREFFKK
jgi:hypothetical protein